MSDEHHSEQPSTRLMQFITGHWVAAAVYASAKLGLADELRDGPKSSEQLAQAVGAHGPSVYRLLRALNNLGVFRESQPGCFELTEVGELLRSDHPRSMRPMALFQGAEPHWHGWGAFLHSVKTGQPAFDHVHGIGFFEYCQTDSEFSEAFNGAMTAMSAAASDAVIEAYNFSGIRRLVDLGGGHGYLLSSILQRYPEMTGTLMDLPHVVKGAKAPIEAAGLADRCELVGGDFFESLPAGDTYIAKNIIHDWDDELAARILRNVRAAMQNKGRVLLVEAVVTPDNRGSMAVLIDLEMLHATDGGRERTESEFADLFAAAGFELERIVPTESLFSIVEATALA